MVIATHPSPNSSFPLPPAYRQAWFHLKSLCERLSLGNPTPHNESHPGIAVSFDLESANTVLKLLGSIKHSLVGSRVRKEMTMNDSEIEPVIPVLAFILELDCEPEQTLAAKLKIEAAAIVGLLCLPDDQTVLVLLRSRLLSALFKALKTLLTKKSIDSIIVNPTQLEPHLLKTLLRTLAAVYSIILDVSSPRKWGYMIKSPERVHQPPPHHRIISKTLASTADAKKGKFKAYQDPSVDMGLPSTTTLPVLGDTSRCFGSSKLNELQTECERGKILLLNSLAQQDCIIALILAITPLSASPSASSMAHANTVDGYHHQQFKLSLCSTAELVVPCFQLIWLLCKDTKCQLCLARALLSSPSADQSTPKPPYSKTKNLLEALVECMKTWLNSSHEQAIESSIRALGSLLSINEQVEDLDLLKSLDQLVWGSDNSLHPENPFTLPVSGNKFGSSEGAGWTLLTCCKARDGSPVLRAALATSSVCLVKNFPEIRLRILKLQIRNTIALIDNATYSIPVRAEAAYALAHAVTVSETLQLQATEEEAIPVLKKLLEKAAEPPFPYPTPAILAQNAMLRESAFLALASLMSTLDQPRDDVLDLNLLPIIVKSLDDDSLLVRAAACQCCRALSRAISFLRTKLADEGAGAKLFELAFDQYGDQEEEEQQQGEQGEEDVVAQLRIVALGALCNLVLDFSPMKQEVLNRNGIEKLVKLLKNSRVQALRVLALWGLKNMTFSAATELKLKVVACLGWEDIYKLLEDDNPSIQENMISLFRNVACGDIADVDIIVKQLDSSSNKLMTLLEDRLTSLLLITNNDTISNDSGSLSLSESIILQTVYTVSNIVTGSQAHKCFILSRPRTMSSICELLSHRNSHIKIGAIWCIINLTYWDEANDAQIIRQTNDQIEALGVKMKLKHLVSSHDTRSDVLERANCALNQINKFCQVSTVAL